MLGRQNRLTDRILRHLHTAAAGPYELADANNLYVRVEPSGSKGFWLRYQIDGRRRRRMLSHYGESGISLAEAGKKRDGAQQCLTKRRPGSCGSRRSDRVNPRSAQRVEHVLDFFA